MPLSASQYRHINGQYQAQNAQPPAAMPGRQPLPEEVRSLADSLAAAQNSPLPFSPAAGQRTRQHGWVSHSLWLMLLLSQIRPAGGLTESTKPIEGNSLSVLPQGLGGLMAAGMADIDCLFAIRDPLRWPVAEARVAPAPAAAKTTVPPLLIGSEGDGQIVVYDKDGEIVNLSTSVYDVVNKPQQHSFIQQGQHALQRYFDSYNNRYPALIRLASSLLRQQLAQRFRLDIDPDRSWFMHFSGGVSNDRSVTGWEHHEAPLEYGTLTSYLFRNFPASAQDNLPGLDQQCGIYRDSPGQTGKFDDTNEVSLRPADFVRLVWDINFYSYASDKIKQAFADKKPHIKKSFVDFVLGLGVSQLDAGSQKDVLSGIGFRIKRSVNVSALDINGYRAATAFIFANNKTGNRVLYLPNNRVKFIAFRSNYDMRAWLVNNCAAARSREMLASHFTLQDRQDGVFFSGVDSWLNQLNDNHDLSDKIATQKIRIKPGNFFAQLVDNLRDKALSDIGVLIKSDREVRRDMWENYVDASGILPNPITPFASLAFHLAHAFDSETYAEKMEEWQKIGSDVMNLILMVLLDKTIKFNDEGYRFINKVRDGFTTLDIAGEDLPGADNQTDEGVSYSGKRGKSDAAGGWLSAPAAKRVTQALYVKNIDASMLTAPDAQGLWYDAQGRSYLQAPGGYVSVQKLNYNRYRIANIKGQREIILRFKNGRYYPEALNERLANILKEGLCGAKNNRERGIALLENLGGYSWFSASDLLNDYAFPEDSILNSYTFACDLVRYGRIPLWAKSYLKKVTPVQSEVKDVIQVHRPESMATVQLKLGKALGEGVSGEVFIDASDDRYVIKRIKKALFDIHTMAAISPDRLLEETTSEVEAFTRYYGHDSAELLQDAHNTCFIRMRKIDGQTLAQLPENSLPSDAIERYVDMLEQLNRLGIQHGDLHPGNIIWNKGRFFPIDILNIYDNYFQQEDKEFTNTEDENLWNFVIRTIREKMVNPGK